MCFVTMPCSHFLFSYFKFYKINLTTDIRESRIGIKFLDYTCLKKCNWINFPPHWSAGVDTSKLQGRKMLCFNYMIVRKKKMSIISKKRKIENWTFQEKQEYLYFVIKRVADSYHSELSTDLIHLCEFTYTLSE